MKIHDKFPLKRALLALTLGATPAVAKTPNPYCLGRDAGKLEGVVQALALFEKEYRQKPPQTIVDSKKDAEIKLLALEDQVRKTGVIWDSKNYSLRVDVTLMTSEYVNNAIGFSEGYREVYAFYGGGYVNHLVAAQKAVRQAVEGTSADVAALPENLKKIYLGPRSELSKSIGICPD